MPGASPERLLLVRLSAMGDVLQTLPALLRLRAALPDAQIGWAVERRFAGLVEGHPAIDRLFVLERRKGAGLLPNARALRALRRELRAWAPDVAIDLQGNLRGALVARASGAPRRIALPAGEAREGAHRFATECVPPAGDPREHRADRALRLVAPLLHAGAPVPPPGTALLPPLAESARTVVRTALSAMEGLGAAGGVDAAGGLRATGSLGSAARPFVLFVAGTSDFGAFKRWPAERFGALATRLAHDANLPVLVSYGPGQEELAAEIAAASGGAARLAPVTSSLAELRALLEEAALVVGADSGPVVLAGMADRPTVALFGPKDPLVYSPRGAAVAAVWKGVYCSPCRLRRCDDPICMTELDEDEVWEGARRAIAAADASVSR